MEKRNKKKKYFTLGFLLVFIMICVTGATYAFFALEATSNANSISGTVGGANLVLTVTKELPTTNPSDMIPQLESTLEDAVNSPYLCIDDHNNVVCQVYKATLRNTGGISAEVDGTISFTNISTLPNLKWKRMDSLTELGEYDSFSATTTEQLFEESAMINPGTTHEYYFVIWVDEIGDEQEDEGTFRATINFNAQSGGVSYSLEDNAVGAAKTIIDLYNTEGDTITEANIGGSTDNPSVFLNSTRGIMKDNNGEYRYYGADPDNYVTFNDELWRIISVGNVKSSENDVVGEARLKIIKSTSMTAIETGTANEITTFSWDSSDSSVNKGWGVNDWSKADLKTELNTLYYNKQSGVCYNGASNASINCNFESGGLSDSSKSLIGDVLWYLGGSSSYADYYANDWYDVEREKSVWGSADGQTCSDGACPRATVWTGVVGLMYPSDYAYATNLSLCTKTVKTYTSVADCTNYNWLFKTIGQWTITINSGHGARVLDVATTGYVGYTTARYAYDVRPVVYLKSNVEIIGGQGTSGQPYQLSLQS